MPYLGPAPADSIVDTAGITDDAVTAAKIAANAVDSSEIAAGAVDLAHMSSESVDEDNLHISNSGSNGQFLSKQSGDSGGLTWAAAEQFANWSQSSGHLTPDNATYGIHLGVATATAANLLDDYEEGTWTPVLWTDSTQPTTSAASMNGRYTKIGRMVEITMTCSFTLSGTGSGTFGVSGLPFTSAATHTATGTLDGRGLNEPGTTVIVNPYIPNGNNKIYFNLYDQDAYPSGQSLLQASTLSTSANGANMNISIVYTAA